MKEYKIVCDIIRTNNRGEVRTIEGTRPYGTNGSALGIHPYKTKAEAKKQLKKYIEWGKEYIRKTELQRSHYPDIYEKMELTNYRILSREVTPWKPEV